MLMGQQLRNANHSIGREKYFKLTKHEFVADADENDLRLAFEIEYLTQLYDEYKPIRLNIWRTFTDTKLRNLLSI